MEVIEIARDSLNDELELVGVLLNLADMRTVHSREAKASLEEALRREGLRDGSIRSRSRMPSRPSGPRRSSITDPIWAPTMWRWRTSCSERLPGMADARERLAKLR